MAKESQMLINLRRRLHEELDELILQERAALEYTLSMGGSAGIGLHPGGPGAPVEPFFLKRKPTHQDSSTRG